MNNLSLKPQLINNILAELKNNHILQDMFKDNGLCPDEVDTIPICFADLDVSARTDHCVIYLNSKLLEREEEIPAYLIHEIMHYIQQSTGDKPSQGADDGFYLDNPDEVEGFQKQVEYLAETEGEDHAEDYVEQVLDHHDLDGKKKEEKKEELLSESMSSRKGELIRLALENY